MSNPYLGEVRVFAGNFAPTGWALCQGQLLAISQNESLFGLIGTTYGGDGVNTFGLPDLRGRALIHQGRGIGLSNYVIGQFGGAEGVTVQTQQLPQHTHSFLGNSASATASNPGPLVTLATTPTGEPIYGSYATDPATPLALTAVTTAGGSQPHENRQPLLAISYIIALVGIPPSGN